MAENKLPDTDWAFVVDPNYPNKSVVLYKGEPIDGVMSVALTVEPVPAAKGEMAILPVLTMKITSKSLTLGTYNSKAAEPVQQELPLG